MSLAPKNSKDLQDDDVFQQDNLDNIKKQIYKVLMGYYDLI